jgi:hypothetical protein
MASLRTIFQKIFEIFCFYTVPVVFGSAILLKSKVLTQRLPRSDCRHKTVINSLLSGSQYRGQVDSVP